MTNNPIADLGIDLGALVDSPATVDVSASSVSVGFDAATATSAGAGLEVELSSTNGVPHLSVEGGGQFTAEGAVAADVSYDAVDLSSDADGTTVVADSVDAGVAAYGGVAAGGEFDIDVYGDGTVGIDAAAEYATETDVNAGADYTHAEITVGGEGYGDELGM